MEESGKILPRVLVSPSRGRFGSRLVEARLVPLEAGASTAVSDVESTKETVEAKSAVLHAVAPVVPGNTMLETPATKPTSGA